MKLSETLELVRAGYTRAEIDAMEAADAQTAAPQASPGGDQVQAQPAPQAQAQEGSQEAASKFLATLIAEAAKVQTPGAAPVQTQQEAAPAPATPAPQPQPQPQPQPVQQPPRQETTEEKAVRILTALGIAAQGIAIPKGETLEDRMANSLLASFGMSEKPKEGGKK